MRISVVSGDYISKEFFIAVAAECRASWIYSKYSLRYWAFCWDYNSVGICDWNYNLLRRIAGFCDGMTKDKAQTKVSKDQSMTRMISNPQLLHAVADRW